MLRGGGWLGCRAAAAWKDAGLGVPSAAIHRMWIIFTKFVLRREIYVDKWRLKMLLCTRSSARELARARCLRAVFYTRAWSVVCSATARA